MNTASLSQVESSQVIQQPDPNAGCAYYAVLNPYLKMGLEPPSLEAMTEAQKQVNPAYVIDGGISIEGGALLMEDIVELPAFLDYPGPVAMGVMGAGREAIDCFPRS